MNSKAQPLLALQQAFWDGRAADYPDPLDPTECERQARRMAKVPEPAQPHAGLCLLDVGAGTGAVALHAAARGAQVTAVDISAAMLARLKQQRAAHGIHTHQADWRNLDVQALGWSRAFDLVYAQMVPSFRDEADFQRLEACSRGWCVFIGWGRVRQDPWLQAAFAAHGVPWEVPPGVPLAAAQLSAMGHDARPVYWHETWHRRGTPAQAIADACDHLRVRGAMPCTAWLEAVGSDPAAPALIQAPIEVELGLLAWPAPLHRPA